MVEWQIFLIKTSIELSGLGFVVEGVSFLCGLIASFLNSNFTTALLGAFAGAYGGQYIVEKSKAKEVLLSEIRNINSAIVLTYDISNRCISLKRQHVKNLKESFDQERGRLVAFKNALQRGEVQPGTVYEFVADLRTLPVLRTPIELLETQLFEKTSPGPHALTLVSVLKQCLLELGNVTERRNAFIENHKKQVSVGEIETISPNQYFGFPDPNGHIDESIPSFIDGIYALTDDSIFFSDRLSKSLVTHCESLTKKFGDKAPKVVRPDFTKAEKLGLMPNPDEYADWNFTEPAPTAPISPSRPSWRTRINFFKKLF